MSSSTHPPTEELRANILALAAACPFDQCNPVDCPLFTLRQMNPQERSQWVHALAESDLMYLATYHYVCLGTKVESKLAERPP